MAVVHGTNSLCGSRRVIFGVFFLLLQMSTGKAGKVLLYPYGHGYTSRMADMIKMAHLLEGNNHHVGFIINNIDIKHLKSVPSATFHTFTAPVDRKTIMDDDDFKASLMSNTTETKDHVAAVWTLMANQVSACEELLRSGLFIELKTAQYELLIVDGLDNCGRVVCQYLDIPTMSYSSTGFMSVASTFPNLPSILPTFLVSTTAEMPFLKRVQNTVLSTFIDFYFAGNFYDAYEKLQDKYDLSHTRRIPFRKAYVDQVSLIHADFALEFPRPLLPNVVLVGGMFVPDAKSLEADLEEFVAGAGEEGVVIVSFGSLINKMDAGKANAIAKTLAKLHQRVIWRYVGTPPEGLGSNTRLMAWMPQTDLLAHPQTRLFLTHCGIHSTYETAWHGVPVVAVPLMFDQMDNAVKLTGRGGMGLQVDFHSLSEESLAAALQEVLENPKFKQNALETSRMLQDHPQTARQRFLFWAEKVMRNKGIGKLALEPMKHMGTFELYCVDVILFLLGVGVIVFMVLMCLARFCWRCICKSTATSSQKAKTS